MKNLKYLFCLCVLLSPFGTYASCSVVMQNPTITFGSITIQRDVPVGTELASATASFGSAAVITCSSTSQKSGQDYVSLFPQKSTYGNGIYDTNIKGVGIQISSASNGSILPITSPFNFTTNNLTIAGRNIKLIKTGPTGTGEITNGEIYYYNVTSNADGVSNVKVASINLTGLNSISTVGCTVKNTALSVHMGLFLTSSFSGVGSTTEEQNFEIPLDCDYGSKVNLTIEAGSSGSSDSTNGILNLDSSNSTIATGVGVQILNNKNPVPLGTQLNIGSVTSDGAFNIPMSARYIQNASKVTPGVANANATFTLQYN